MQFRDVELLRYLVLIKSVLSYFGGKRGRFVKGSLFLGYRLSCLCFLRFLVYVVLRATPCLVIVGYTLVLIFVYFIFSIF